MVCGLGKYVISPSVKNIPAGQVKDSLAQAKAMSVKWAIFRMLKKKDEGEDVDAKLLNVEKEHFQDV